MQNPKKRLMIFLGLLLLLTLVFTACSQETVEVTRVVEVPGPEVEVTREVEVEVPGPEVEVTRIVEVMVEPEQSVSAVPFLEQWQSSGHADVEAEAFNHWNEEDPQEVPTGCAKCHSTPGYLDFLGADGTEFGTVENASPIGTTVECAACHNDVTLGLTSVVFPSGVEVMGLGDESRCMQCHQGRSSKLTVDQGIIDAGLDPVADLDVVSEDVGFTNIHYYAAAATLYGKVAMGGYEYDGKAYDGKFDHVAGYDSCIDCHNPHTLEVKVDECSGCHTDVTSVEDLVNIRMPGSLVDYDGDGDMEEGIMFEIQGMQEMLLQAMQAYSTEIAGTGITYDAAAYPYFFNDAGERYATWTARLAKAAYNYQVSQKDPGEFAHGGKYIIELLYDSIEDLNSAISAPVDLTNAHRIDHGHFAGSEEAFRHWDEEGFVSGSCSRCHSATGLPLYLTQGVTINEPTSNGLNCATCHSDLTTFALYEADSATFPSGATVSLAVDETDEAGLKSNLCLQCHQGRESTVSVDRTLSGLEDDVASESIRFRNVHYFAAGATLFGTEVKGAYEFADQTYLGRNVHVEKFDTCVECHNAHALEVKYDECAFCHENVETPEDLHAIRVSETDFDGDGDVTEGLYGEIQTMADVLYAAMQDYSTNTAGSTIVYNGSSYPYFFNDAGESYASWTPNLLRAGYNYQYVQKDPGAFAHNGLYIIQLLYDSINAVGGDTTGMTRP
ncbi:MAG: cytochrome c3 family protein [Ardenticatenaceae bacterium]|nr:cytochrome c3 family protein [Ardenticatenaceae bacterium]